MIFITGSNGFIGKHLIDYFSENNIIYKTDIGLYDSKNKRYHSDIDWFTLLEEVDVIVHLAGKSNSNITSSYPKKKVNEHIDVELIECLIKHAIDSDVKRFVHVSSIKALGNFSHLNQPFSPNDIPRPKDFYGITKLESENLLKKITKDKIDYVIIRLPLVYGRHVKENFLSLMSLVQKKIPIPLFINDNKRSFVSINNVVNFIKICTDHENAKNEIFHLSDGNDLSTSELLYLIANNMNIRLLLFPLPKKFMKLILKLFNKENIYDSLYLNLQVNIEKNYQLLEWLPSKNFEMNLKITIDSYINEKNL